MTTRAAMMDYFAGERLEMVAILGGATSALIAAVALYMLMRDGFAIGLAITILIATLLLGSTAISLLVRDGKAAPILMQSVSSNRDAEAALQRERMRVEVIVRNYPTYRYVAAGGVVLALVGLLLFARGWIHGVATGLLLLAAAQIVIDHYSERRARLYLKRLALHRS